jgi:hypothetical protein
MCRGTRREIRYARGESPGYGGWDRLFGRSFGIQSPCHRRPGGFAQRNWHKGRETLKFEVLISIVHPVCFGLHLGPYDLRYLSILSQVSTCDIYDVEFLSTKSRSFIATLAFFSTASLTVQFRRQRLPPIEGYDWSLGSIGVPLLQILGPLIATTILLLIVRQSQCRSDPD